MITSFPFALCLLFGVLANETYSEARKRDYECEPQHEENNREDLLALIEKLCRVHG